MYAKNLLPVLTANAGADIMICPNVTGNLSGSATGGTGPYSYHWEPAGLCFTPNSQNTVVTNTVSTNFTLTVTSSDSVQTTAQDIVTVFVDDIWMLGAGPDKGRCYLGGAPVTLGNTANYQGGYTYSWVPVSDLSNPTAPRPLATPSVTTTWTVTITSPLCGPIVDSVTVSVWTVNPDAGPNVTINQGETATLTGTGANQYFWSPNSGMMYSNTDHPDVNPSITTTYYLQGGDGNGCFGYDSVTVFIRPSTELYFYNTFTPNGDGSNDIWVIANLFNYPNNKLEIYNRYGQLIFKKTGYANDWNGMYLGEELPSGTYFYVLDTKDDAGVFKGSVTIIR
ncbi:MAG: gliding motility-associated C-terminal domain-containing protein [Bacteroidia bacterium]|nr:gliding motility-associated C-terminal domain-containing protein [Bacteroidia bacterium]